MLNAATGFLDASPVYDEAAAACRYGYATMIGRTRSGRLESTPCPRFVVETVQTPRTRVHAHTRYWTHIHGRSDFSGSAENFRYSATVRSLLVSEHNRLVSQLSAANPSWSNDTLFEEAKRITIAQLQHVTYHEFIPNVVGHVSKNR